MYDKRLLQGCLQIAKAEIDRDIVMEVVSATVASFSELHEYVDANCYGGLCEDRFHDSFFPEGDDGEPNADLVPFVNDLQNTLDKWIKEGRPQ